MSTLNASTAALSQQTAPVKGRRKSAFRIRPFSVAVYAGVFMLVITLVSLGYHEPKKSSVIASQANVSTPIQVEKTAVDDVVATSVAADVAQLANLPIATSVSNLAVSIQTKSEYIQTDTISITKPQIIESTVSNRKVVIYTVKDGDTIDSLAAKFKISKQTIKWANNMTADKINVGDTLKILPVDGVLYTVKSGDTFEELSKKYGVDQTRIITNNDLEVSGLVANNEIILPDANLPYDERPGYVAPITYNFYYSGYGTGFGGRTWYIKTGTPGYAGNTYYQGNCTRYAYDRRIELGLLVSSGWGHAYTWAANAAAAGLTVDHVPSVGAIMQNVGGYGHVAVVEAILDNGDLSISEMNAYVPGGGWNIVSGRIIPAGNVTQYMFIH